jgi:hypothetical protein
VTHGFFSPVWFFGSVVVADRRARQRDGQAGGGHMMAELCATGRVADIVLLCLFVEVVALAVLRRRTGRGPALADILALALPGAFLSVERMARDLIEMLDHLGLENAHIVGLPRPSGRPRPSLAAWKTCSCRRGGAKGSGYFSGAQQVDVGEDRAV